MDTTARLKGKIALAGGASRGAGRGIACALGPAYKAGWCVLAGLGPSKRLQ